MKQMNCWIDITANGDVGIECDDPSQTFDGHYVCVFPRASNEKDSEKALQRAEMVLEYMRGKKQIAR